MIERIEFDSYFDSLAFRSFDCSKPYNRGIADVLEAVNKHLKSLFHIYDLLTPGTADNNFFNSVYVPINRIEYKDCFVDLLKVLAQTELPENPSEHIRKIIEENANSMEHPPQYLLLVGCPGVGKSSFVRNFCSNFFCGPVINRNGTSIDVIYSLNDFNAGISSCQHAKELLKKEEKDRRVLDVRSRVLTEMEKSNGLKVDHSGDFTIRIDNIYRACRDKIFISIIDNIDLQDKSIDEMIFVKAINEIQNEFKIRRSRDRDRPVGFTTLIVAIRRSTLFHIFGRKLLSLEQFRSVMLTSPTLVAVFEKRSQYLSQKIKAEGLEVGVKYRVQYAEGAAYSWDVSLNHAVRLFSKTVSCLDDESKSLLHHVTLGNVRAQLRIILEFITNPTLVADQNTFNNLVVSIFQGKDEEIKLEFRHILIALYGIPKNSLSHQDFISMEYLYSSHDFENLGSLKGDSFKAQSWNYFLVKTRIIQYLQWKRADAQVDNGYHIEVRHVFADLGMLGYSYESIERGIKSLLGNRLIICDELTGATVYDTSTSFIVITSLGEYFIKNVATSFSYLIISMEISPITEQITNLLDRSNNIFLASVYFWRLLSIMEEVEKQTCERLGSHSVGLRDEILSSTHIISDRLYFSLFAEFNKIKGRQYNKAISAITTLNKFKMEGFVVSCAKDIRHVNNMSVCGKCLSDLDRFFREPEKFSSPYIEKSWKIEMINYLSPTGRQQTIGAEMFYLHAPGNPSDNDGVTEMPRHCSQEGKGCGGAHLFKYANVTKKILPYVLDVLLLNSVLRNVKSVFANGLLRFVSVNIHPELFEKNQMLDEKVLLQHFNNGTPGNIVLEFPEEVMDIAEYIKSCKKLLSHSCDDKVFGCFLDDHAAQHAMDKATICPTDELSKFCGVKLDYKWFQGMYRADQNVLMEILHKISCETSDRGQILIIEGVEFRHHLEFIYAFVEEYGVSNICIQGYFVKEKNELDGGFETFVKLCQPKCKSSAKSMTGSGR